MSLAERNQIYKKQDKNWDTNASRWYCPECGTKHSTLESECSCGYNRVEAFAKTFVSELTGDIEEELN